jgi:hypothetical protein
MVMGLGEGKDRPSGLFKTLVCSQIIAPVLHEVAAVLDRIDALLGGAPPVLELERTLTDGYATALALEGERIRIERKMHGVAASIDADPDGAKELSALAERRAKVDSDLSYLRERLGVLRRRASELRAVVPQPGLG